MLQIIAGLFQRISEKILGLFRKKPRSNLELVEVLQAAYIRGHSYSSVTPLISTLRNASIITNEESLRLRTMYDFTLKDKVNVMHYFNQSPSHSHRIRRDYCHRFIIHMKYIELMQL
jgi:uncharacterized protein HemY